MCCGIATRYGLGGPGIESLWRRDFRVSPDWSMGPSSFLYNAYRIILGRKAAGAWHKPLNLI